MKTKRTTCIVMTMVVCFATFCEMTPHSVADERKVDEGRLKLMILDSHPNIPGDMYNYARYNNMPMSNIVTFYETLVSTLLLEKETNEENRVLIGRACFALGELGYTTSTNVLAKAIRAKDQRCEYYAIRGYIKICKEDSFEFVEEVVRTVDKRRYDVYNALTPYLEYTSDEILETKRGAIRQLLMKAIDKEPKGDCAMKLDEILLSTVPSYRRSMQRAGVAERFKMSKVPVWSKHFDKVAEEMSKVPARERKDLLAAEGLEEFVIHKTEMPKEATSKETVNNSRE